MPVLPAFGGMCLNQFKPSRACFCVALSSHAVAGRGGTCELMIGCIAKATSTTLHVDETEMDDVRWVSRELLQKAVQDSQRMDTPYHGESISKTLACTRIYLTTHHIVQCI